MTDGLLGAPMMGCEPVMLMIHIAGGPGASMAVAYKSLTILGAVVLAKAVIFAIRAGPSRVGAAAAMVVANVVTTVLAFLVIGMVASPPTIIPGLIAMLVAAHFGFRYVKPYLENTPWRNMSESRFAIVSLCLTLVALFSSAWTQFNDGTDAELVRYWILKVSGIFLTLLVTIPLTIMWESAICLLMNGKTDPARTVRACIFANLAVFLGVFLVGAMIAIPIRNRSRDWMMP